MHAIDIQTISRPIALLFYQFILVHTHVSNLQVKLEISHSHSTGVQQKKYKKGRRTTTQYLRLFKYKDSQSSRSR